MKTLALGLAGVLIVGASVKAEEPSPLDKRTFVLEAKNGQIRLKPKGAEKVPGAQRIFVPPQGVTIEAGPDNTVIFYVDIDDEGKPRGLKHKASRTLLILPEYPDQADPFPKPTAVTRAEGLAGGGQQIERRLTEIEQKLELILKELKDLKGR